MSEINSQHDELKFLVNESLGITIKIDQSQCQYLCEGSTLLNGLLQSCQIQKHEELKLQLERPEKFCVILRYLQTGKMGEELANYGTFASYVNDVTYLGIEKLEMHALETLQKAVQLSKCDQIDFSQSPPSYDFMERFMREKAYDLKGYNYDLFVLITNWVGNIRIAREQIQQLISGYLNFEQLTLEQVKSLSRDYQNAFDMIMPGSFLIDNWMTKLVTCKKCMQQVLRASIGQEKCRQARIQQSIFGAFGGYHNNSNPVIEYFEEGFHEI